MFRRSMSLRVYLDFAGSAQIITDGEAASSSDKIFPLKMHCYTAHGGVAEFVEVKCRKIETKPKEIDEGDREMYNVGMTRIERMGKRG